MTPAELEARKLPMPCEWCGHRLALCGEGSNYCEVCRPMLDQNRKYSPNLRAWKYGIRKGKR